MFDLDIYNEINKHPYNSFGLIKRTFKRFFRADPKPQIATVVFVDMCSSLLLKIDHSEVWQENIFYLQEKAKKVLKLCNGKFSKNIGDCVLCYFVGENQIDNSFKFVYSMLEHFRLLNDNLKMDSDTSLFTFKISIGMASGEVYFLYPNDPFGITVDLAARLQGKSEAQQACFPSTLANLVKDEKLQKFYKKSITEDVKVDVKPFGEFQMDIMTIDKYLE